MHVYKFILSTTEKRTLITMADSLMSKNCFCDIAFNVRKPKSLLLESFLNDCMLDASPSNLCLKKLGR